MISGNALFVYSTSFSPESNPVNVGTSIRLISTIGMLTIGEGTLVTDEYKLKEALTAEVKVEDGQYIVVEYRTDEYGIGGSRKEAQQDLLHSLVDYLTSLERREDRLGNRELVNLQTLRNMLVK